MTRLIETRSECGEQQKELKELCDWMGTTEDNISE